MQCFDIFIQNLYFKQNAFSNSEPKTPVIKSTVENNEMKRKNALSPTNERKKCTLSKDTKTTDLLVFIINSERY